jgi:hypothetical protein
MSRSLRERKPEERWLKGWATHCFACIEELLDDVPRKKTRGTSPVVGGYDGGG